MNKQENRNLKDNFAAIGWTLKKFFGFYPVLAPLTVFCILFSAIVAAIPAVFIQRVLAVIERWYQSGNWAAARAEILPYIFLLVGLYTLSILSLTLETQLMAVMTQGFLDKMRREMFDGMQDLPIKYFDTHKHGDIMSYYTNDIDTLRQLVGQSFPTLVRAGIIVFSVLCIMLYYSIYLTLLILTGVVFMFFVSKKFGGGSARYH